STSGRPLFALAACPTELSTPPPAAGRLHSLRWLSRAADRSHEPGRRTPLDSLARTDRSRDAGGRQRLLHGLPVHGATNTRTVLASSGPELAAEQVAGGLLAHRLSVGLRGVRTLGQPVVDRLDRSGLLLGSLRDRWLFSRCGLLQVCMPDRPVQLRAIADFTAANQGAQPRRLRFVPDEGLYPGERGHSRLRAAPVPAPEVEQHGLHILSRLYSRLPS